MSTDAPCLCLPALARGKQEALDALPADYYQPDYDPVAGELAMLPRMFTEGDLEAVVEERSGVLEVHAPTFTRDRCCDHGWWCPDAVHQCPTASGDSPSHAEFISATGSSACVLP